MDMDGFDFFFDLAVGLACCAVFGIIALTFVVASLTATGIRRRADRARK